MSLRYDFDPSELDEFLVEYVDGTMDPVVREAFEEFLRVYPEIRSQVDQLSSIRSSLCKLGDDCRCEAPPGFQDRLKRQLDCEMAPVLSLEEWAPQLNMIALVFSITILALAVGLSQFEGESAFADASTTAGSQAQTMIAASLVSDSAPRTETAAPVREWGRMSLLHNASNASFSAPFDRPMLLSARRDFVAFKPVLVSTAP